MRMLLRFIGTIMAVIITIKVVPGVSVTGGWTSIFLIALVWSVISIAIKPVLTILTLPITLLTFGLFSFVLNALLFWAMTLIVPGFIVSNFLSALLGALVLSIVGWLIHRVF
jgi:putative membrane protein